MDGRGAAAVDVDADAQQRIRPSAERRCDDRRTTMIAFDRARCGEADRSGKIERRDDIAMSSAQAATMHVERRGKEKMNDETT